MIFARFDTTYLYKFIGIEPLYNFAVEKVKIVRQIACRIAKVEPSSTSAMAQLRQLRGVRFGVFPVSRLSHRKKASVNPALCSFCGTVVPL